MTKEILLRLIIYPFYALLFYGFWQMTFESANRAIDIYDTKAKLVGPIGLIFSLIYPVTDILIGLKKLFKKK
ncbi:hypothetical protein [Winogradskyella litorisediminis]|uniref:hypothetical protein n=1 Tax=Winogradskyella litorisediminis TaxID=1156618 RepID=UPI0036DB7ACA